MSGLSRHDRAFITRAVYWENRQEPGLALLEGGGYDIDSRDESWGRTHLVSRNGEVLAVLHAFDEPSETFAFLFTAEAQCPRWREWLWRLSHPLTARTADPARAEA
jgi:hypothetical protein